MEREKVEKVRRSCVVMKDYLNNAETKELIILNQVSLLAKKFVEGNIMTKEEKLKRLKGVVW